MRKVTTEELIDMIVDGECIAEVDYSHITEMDGLFAGLHNLKEITYLDTSTVTNMAWMFHGCSSLESIPKLDTSKVTNMRNMFSGCTKLKSIPDLDYGSVQDCRYMFLNCISLREANFIAPRALSAESMFDGCALLQKASINMPFITVAQGIFANCERLEEIESFYAPEIRFAERMFLSNAVLRTIPEMHMPKLLTMDNIFNGCNELDCLATPSNFLSYNWLSNQAPQHLRDKYPELYI